MFRIFSWFRFILSPSLFLFTTGYDNDDDGVGSDANDIAAEDKDNDDSRQWQRQQLVKQMIDMLTTTTMSTTNLAITNKMTTATHFLL